MFIQDSMSTEDKEKESSVYVKENKVGGVGREEEEEEEETKEDDEGEKEQGGEIGVESRKEEEEEEEGKEDQEEEEEQEDEKDEEEVDKEEEKEEEEEKEDKEKEKKEKEEEGKEEEVEKEEEEEVEWEEEKVEKEEKEEDKKEKVGERQNIAFQCPERESGPQIIEETDTHVSEHIRSPPTNSSTQTGTGNSVDSRAVPRKSRLRLVLRPLPTKEECMECKPSTRECLEYDDSTRNTNFHTGRPSNPPITEIPGATNPAEYCIDSYRPNCKLHSPFIKCTYPSFCCAIPHNHSPPPTLSRIKTHSSEWTESLKGGGKRGGGGGGGGGGGRKAERGQGEGGGKGGGEGRGGRGGGGGSEEMYSRLTDSLADSLDCVLGEGGREACRRENQEVQKKRRSGSEKKEEGEEERQEKEEKEGGSGKKFDGGKRVKLESKINSSETASDAKVDPKSGTHSTQKQKKKHSSPSSSPSPSSDTTSYSSAYLAFEFMPLNTLPEELETIIFPRHTHPLMMFDDPYWPSKAECLRVVEKVRGKEGSALASFTGTFLSPEAHGERCGIRVRVCMHACMCVCMHPCMCV